MLTEVDTRTILGNGGSVLLAIDEDDSAPFPVYRVFVADTAGAEIASLSFAERADAARAFYHPFADATVPDVFKKEVQQ